MVSYGPWVQDPAYEQYTTYTVDATYDNRYLGDDGGGGYTDNPQSASPRQVLLYDLEQALYVAKAAHGDVSGQGIDHGVEVGYGQQMPTVVPPMYLSNWGATYTRARWRVAPSPDGYSYSPSSEGHFDPDAVALQFEGSDPGPTYMSGAASIEGVTIGALTTIITRVGDSSPTNGLVPGDLSDGSWQTDVVLHPDGGSDTVLHRVSGFAQTTEANTYTTTLGTNIDVTALLASAGWSGELWTETPAVILPRKMPESATEVASGIVRYGWLLLRPRISYMVKPPRYRWVYADDGPPSYRRIFPRADGLGGGAPRNWPRPKSIQASNRTSGGYL